MDNIKKYLNESLNRVDFDINDWLKTGHNIPRLRMPQLPKENYDKFIAHFSNKYKLKFERVPVYKLKPIQGEVNMDKINKLVKKKNISKDRTFFVSKNFGIADGTHGIASLLLKDPNTEVNIYRTNLDCKKMIEILNKMKYTFNKGVNENDISFKWNNLEQDFNNITFEWK